MVFPYETLQARTLGKKMVLLLDVNQVFRFVTGIRLHRKK